MVLKFDMTVNHYPRNMGITTSYQHTYRNFIVFIPCYKHFDGPSAYVIFALRIIIAV